MSSEKKSYSIDELRELKALSNSNVEIIGNITFEPTHGYVAAPSRHSSVKKNAETDSSGGVSLVDSLKTSFTNWADDDDEEEENYWHISKMTKMKKSYQSSIYKIDGFPQVSGVS